MNEFLLMIEMLATFSLLVLAKKLFGKEGLYAWIAIASIVANIQVVKSVTLFGLEATLGNVLFASNFLATDILAECYGEKEAKKGVHIGLFAVIVYLICTQLAVAFEPNNIDVVHSSMSALFTIAPRVCAASVIMFYLSNYIDVKLYSKLRRVFKGRKMWLRNNISTIICNSLENYGFFLLAFAGSFPLNDIMVMGLTSSIIEVVVALCDTPFLYFAKNKVRS